MVGLQGSRNWCITGSENWAGGRFRAQNGTLEIHCTGAVDVSWTPEWYDNAPLMQRNLGTLDAIHLASALLWKDAMSIDPVMATHDGALGIAAHAHGLQVIGT